MQYPRYDKDLSKFPKWVDCIARMGNQTFGGEWSLMKTDSDRITHVDYVNQNFNQMRYVADGVTDFWQTPAEFMQSGSGDCEDFAIAKYMELLKFGCRSAEIVICSVRKTRQIHAVTRVFIGDSYVVMDNRTKALLTMPQYQNAYDSIFALTLQGWRLTND